jgi:hypothetical protein
MQPPKLCWFLVRDAGLWPFIIVRMDMRYWSSLTSRNAWYSVVINVIGVVQAAILIQGRGLMHFGFVTQVFSTWEWRKQTEKFPQYVGASFGVLRFGSGAIIELDAIVRTTTTWHRRLTINSRPFGTLLEGYVLLLDYSEPLLFFCDEELSCHVNGKVCDPSFSGTCFLFAVSFYFLEIPNAASTKRRNES